MAMTVLIRRSNVSGKAPAVEQLAPGELAINTYDGMLYFVQNGVSGNATIVALGTMSTTLLRGLVASPPTAVTANDTVVSGVSKLQAQIDTKVGTASPFFSGTLSATVGSFGTIIASPSIIIQNSVTATWQNRLAGALPNQSISDCHVTEGQIAFRLVNDNTSASNTWLSVSRTGYVADTITLAASTVVLTGAVSATSIDATPFGITSPAPAVFTDLTVTGDFAAVGTVQASDITTGSLHAVNPTSDVAVVIDTPSGDARCVQYRANGVDRWRTGTNADDAHANTGTDYTFTRFDDSGHAIDIPIAIARSNGIVGFRYSPLVPTLPAGTDTLQAASTAFVTAAVTAATPLRILLANVAITSGANTIITPAADYGYSGDIGLIETTVRVLDSTANSATFNMKINAEAVASVAYTANTIIVSNDFTAPLTFDILLRG